VFSPGSLTNIVVILIGLALLYLAITEGLAAWASPKEPRVGMTTEQVKASCWGPPVNITHVEGEEGADKKWSYGGTRAVLFNRRGRVISVER